MFLQRGAFGARAPAVPERAILRSTSRCRGIRASDQPQRFTYTLAVSAADDQLVHLLEADPLVQLAVLFGSAAVGRLRPDSDVDIGVLGPAPRDLPALQLRLERITGRPVDIVPLDTAPPLLRFEVARDGRLLVERVPHLWSDFKARAMVDWWDWAPTARLFHRSAAARLEGKGVHGPS
jgi:predicted nucleotidyltransferase